MKDALGINLKVGQLVAASYGGAFMGKIVEIGKDKVRVHLLQKWRTWKLYQRRWFPPEEVLLLDQRVLDREAEKILNKI